jgi:hypothetical protein
MAFGTGRISALQRSGKSLEGFYFTIPLASQFALVMIDPG